MMPLRSSDGEYLSVQQVADLAGFHERTVRRAISSGDLRAFRLGGHRLRVRRVDAVAWVEREPVRVDRPEPVQRRQPLRRVAERGSYRDLLEIERKAMTG